MKYLYWFLHMTWGILTFIPGFIITIVLAIAGHRPRKNGYGFITSVGGDWGGLSLGPFAFCGSYDDLESPYCNVQWYYHTRCHEFGHSVSQCMWMGPFYLFIVAIPSAIRYWYYVLSARGGKRFPPDWYDSVWFEGMATKNGIKWIKKIEEE